MHEKRIDLEFLEISEWQVRAVRETGFVYTDECSFLFYTSSLPVKAVLLKGFAFCHEGYPFGGSKKRFRAWYTSSRTPVLRYGTSDGLSKTERENYIMLIDLHAHSSGISRCCRIDAEEVIRTAKGIGLDGIVLTNHYQKNYVTDGDYDAFAARYMREFEHARDFGAQLDFHVLFGIEVTAERYSGVHLLIYGAHESFLTKHPKIFDASQEEMYEIAHENGAVLIQAHPYRRQDRLLCPAYLDGVEISCHPLYEGTHLDALTRVAEENGLILTCGGDYHADTYRPYCGMYLPDSITEGRALGSYLASAEKVCLAVQEVDGSNPFDVLYRRTARENGKA